MGLPFARHLLVAIVILLAGSAARGQTNAVPFLHPLNPSATTPGGPGFTLAVHGRGFERGAVVNWNGSPRATTFVSSTRLTAVIETADVARAGTAVITVTNPGPAGRTSNSESFELQTLPPPDFTGSVNPTYQSVLTGRTANYGITISAINGFAGEILLKATELPQGTTAAFWPNTVTGSGSTTLQISTTAATPTGTYHITLTATSGSLVHSGGVTLSVGPAGTNFADFTGSVQPSYQTIQPGGNTSFNIEIEPLYGFASNVSMSVSGLPAGGTAAFNPSVVTGGNGPTVLAVSVPSSTPTGTYRITITGMGGGRSHDNTVAVNVGPPGMDFTDFTGSITPLARTVTVGGSTTFTVNIQPLYGTGCITLQTLDVPAATGAAYDRTTAICGGPASTVLTITTTPQTPVGTYTITIQGLSSGGFTHSQNITLTATPP